MRPADTWIILGNHLTPRHILSKYIITKFTVLLQGRVLFFIFAVLRPAIVEAWEQMTED